MGLGKTLQTILWMSRNPEARPAVIVCPASIKFNWQKEMLQHAGMDSCVLEGTKVKEWRLVERPSVYVVNYDILHAWLEYLTELKPRLVVFDESHHLGNMRSRRTRCAKRLAANAPHRIALSGTPLTNRPAELWPVLNILRPDLWPSFHSYAVAHCAPRKRFWGWDYSGASRLSELRHKLLANVMIRRRKEDVLHQLPPKRQNTVALELSDRKEYERAQSHFLEWLRDKDPTKLTGAQRAEAVVKVGYLLRLVGELKMKAVLEWADDFLHGSEGKLVLMAVHKRVIAALTEKYKKRCVVVDGSVTGKARFEAVERFQKDDRVRVFVGNVKAAGVGITLTAAADLAFVEFPWTPGAFDQCADRTHRISQEKSVTITLLAARDTIDDHMIRLLERKRVTTTAVLDGGDDIPSGLLEDLCLGMKRGD